VGGYLVNPTSIPAWLRWLRYLSPLSFAFEALFGNEFRGQYYNFGVEGYEVSRRGGRRRRWRTTAGHRPGC
jgi:hypothetical protein